MNVKIKAIIISRNEIDVTVNKTQLLDCVKKWSLEQRLELVKDVIERNVPLRKEFNTIWGKWMKPYNTEDFSSSNIVVIQ